jgi:putative sporulation protein YtaF
MMQVFCTTVLIAFTNSIDNLGAWIAFDSKGIKVTAPIHLWLSFLTFAVSTASCFAGLWARGVLDGSVCAWISMAILTAMGVWFLLEPVLSRRLRTVKSNSLIHILENPEDADINKSKDIDFREATLLGLALSLNNAGGCLSAGMLGLNPWLTGALSALFSFGALWVGRLISAFLRRVGLERKASLLSGALLILLGIRQVL